MKVQVKTREDHDSQQYKFRPRAFTIDRVFEVDKSTLRKLFANDTFSEWQELLSGEEITEKVMFYSYIGNCLCLYIFLSNVAI